MSKERELQTIAERREQLKSHIDLASRKIESLPVRRGEGNIGDKQFEKAARMFKARMKLCDFISSESHELEQIDWELSNRMYTLPDGQKIRVKNENALAVLEELKELGSAAERTTLAHKLFEADIKSGVYTEGIAKDRVSAAKRSANEALKDTVWEVKTRDFVMVDGKKKKVPTAYFLTLREKPKEVQREKGVVVFDHAKINVPVIVNISEVDIPAGGIDLMPTVGKPKREISAEQLRRASPEDVGQIVDTQVNRILEEHPGISSFHLYKLIAEALPGRIPETVQAEASLETKLFFNMKTIISATEDLFSDNDDENNEIIQAAVTSAYKVLTHPDTKVPLSIRIYQAAARGAANYIAIRDNIPISWIVPNIKSYKIIRRVFESDFLDGQRILTNDEVDSLTREIAEQTDISQSHLKDYIVYRNSLKNCSTQEDEEIDGGDDVLGTVMYVDLREKIEENLETILPRQRKVLEQRYGLWDGKEWTLEEVGHELGVDRGRVRVIEARALRKLRHPSRTRKVRDYYS